MQSKLIHNIITDISLFLAFSESCILYVLVQKNIKIYRQKLRK